jgi:hypothetical protein
MNEDLQDWNDNLHKQIKYEQEKNKLGRACLACGDKGYHLEKHSTKVGYDSLDLVLCTCQLGVNLREKWLRQDEERNKTKKY